MNEIQTLLKPLTDRYFQNGQVFDLESVYKEVVVLEKEQLEDLKKDVVEKFRRAEDSFTEVTGEEQEFLQKFALICLLSFDVYMKKMIVEPSAKQTAECEARVLESIFLETTSRKGQQEHYGSNNRRITSDDLTESGESRIYQVGRYSEY